MFENNFQLQPNSTQHKRSGSQSQTIKSGGFKPYSSKKKEQAHDVDGAEQNPAFSNQKFNP